MPNWCENYIVITGDKDSIQKIRENIEGKESTDCVFETLVGRERGENTEEYPDDAVLKYFGGRGSNLDLYGTKWDVDYRDCNFEFYEDRVMMSPLTAWSPPENFCITLSEKYGVKVNITYGEGGNDFYGRLIVENGVILENVSHNSYLEGMYELDPEDFWERVEGYVDCPIADMLDEGEYEFEKILESFKFLKTDEDKEKLREICDDLEKEFVGRA